MPNQHTPDSTPIFNHARANWGDQTPTREGDLQARLVIHGAKLDTDALADALDECCMLARIDRDRIDLRPTLAAGEATELAREAVALGAERVIAIGGDGTINEVLAGLMQAPASARPALGVVPLGTANDFATCAGIPTELTAALQLALTGPIRRIDVARCGDRPYLNMASAGLLSELAASADPRLKQLLGGLAYVIVGIVGLAELEPLELELHGPDVAWSGRAFALAVGNARTAGGGFELCPGASVIDGLLNVTVLPESLDLGDGLRLLEARSVGEVPGVHRFDCVRLSVQAKRKLHINIDGEPTSATDVEFSIEAAALDVALPDDSPLLGS